MNCLWYWIIYPLMIDFPFLLLDTTEVHVRACCRQIRVRHCSTTTALYLSSLSRQIRPEEKLQTTHSLPDRTHCHLDTQNLDQPSADLASPPLEGTKFSFNLFYLYFSRWQSSTHLTDIFDSNCTLFPSVKLETLFITCRREKKKRNYLNLTSNVDLLAVKV